jgi:hypothetical protein
MPRQTKLTNSAEEQFINNLFNASAPFRIRLFQNAILVTDATLVADFVEADYSGYAAQVVNYGGESHAADGFAGVPGEKAFTLPMVALFNGSSGADQTVYGMYVTDNNDIPLQVYTASNCFDANPEAALLGRTISGPSDFVLLAIRWYLWDYFKGKSFDGATFQFKPVPTVQVAGSNLNSNIYRMLQGMEVDRAYGGTATLTTSDGSGSVTSPVVFTSGVGTFSASLVTAGTTTLAATDVIDDTVVGQQMLEVA